MTSRVVLCPELLRLQRKVHEGAYAAIFFGDCMGQPVAVKQLLPRHRLSSTAMEDFWSEEQILYRCQGHPRVISILGSHDPHQCPTHQKIKKSARHHQFPKPFDPWYPYLVLEWIEGFTLQDWLHKYRHTAPESAVPRLLLEIAVGMRWIHFHQVIHRDLKPANVLLDSLQHRIKLCDFNLGLIMDPPPSSSSSSSSETKTPPVQAGTLAYESPECLADRVIDEKADSYSFGIIAYQLVTGDLHPYSEFSDRPSDELRKELLKGYQLPLPVTFDDTCHLSRDVFVLLPSLLSPFPEKRPSMSELIEYLSASLKRFCETEVPTNIQGSFPHLFPKSNLWKYEIEADDSSSSSSSGKSTSSLSSRSTHAADDDSVVIN